MAAYPYTYATVDDVKARYDADFLDRIVFDKTAQQANYDRLADSLEDATGEIDSYISAVYQVPLSPVPNLLKRMCMDMAIYHTAITADRMTEELGIRYKQWLTHLDKIANRKVGLGIAAGQPVLDANGQPVTDASGTPVVAAAPTQGTGANVASSGRTIRI